MKLALILATLALSAPLAHAGEPVAFFDAQKVMTTSAEGKKNAADEAADLKAKQAEVTAALEAAKKADAACAKDSKGSVRLDWQGPPPSCAEASKKDSAAQQLGQSDQQELARRQQADAEKLAGRINRVLPAVAKAKHLGAILPAGGAFYVGPSLDVTAEVIRRLDSGEGTEPVVAVDEVAALKAELARVKAENAALTKPAPPTVPPPPPTQPIASKGKK